MNRDKIIRKYAVSVLIILSLMTVGASLYLRLNSGDVPVYLKKLLNENETVIDYTRDGPVVYALVSHGGKEEYGDMFVTFHIGDNGGWERFYENDFKQLKPWKIETADIDGNSDKEIMIAVRKTTKLDPEEKNRMFVFNFINGRLVKKWTGSQIAGSWVDFSVGDVVSIPGKELIFTEKTEYDGRERVSIYYWFDFGFLRLAVSGKYPPIKNLTVLGEGKLQISYKENRKDVTVKLDVRDGQLVKTD